MLDLVGYTTDLDLAASTIIEPGCGEGAFLVEIAKRLLQSAVTRGRRFEDLGRCIRAYDIDVPALGKARQQLLPVLLAFGVQLPVAEAILADWLVTEDFLIATPTVAARWVVGNPPYMRVEDIDPTQYARYRRLWPTMRGRADIYVGFFEASLEWLRADGQLCFVCADRWMHNQYGAALRQKILTECNLDRLIEVHGVDAFDTTVIAYPAITVFRKGPRAPTVMATATSNFGQTDADSLLSWMREHDPAPVRASTFSGAKLEQSFSAGDSWPSGPPDQLAMIANLESRFARITEVGVDVSVGLATGADKVYIVGDDVPVESSLMQRIVGPSDLSNGEVRWQGRYVISPWVEGQLAPLEKYPSLNSYVRRHSETLKRRHVSKRVPNQWWRTIDKPREGAYKQPKLLVADINDRIEPILDTDGYWPMHSVYFIRSTQWDLEALGGYLLSEVASSFLNAYSVRMARGHLRVSAQYIKRIRLPLYEDVSSYIRAELREAFSARDRARASRAVRALLWPSGG